MGIRARWVSTCLVASLGGVWALAQGGAPPAGIGVGADGQPAFMDGVTRTLTGTLACTTHDAIDATWGHRPVFRLHDGSMLVPLLENALLAEVEAKAGAFHPEGDVRGEIRRSPVKVRARLSVYRGRNYMRITDLVRVLTEAEAEAESGRDHGGGTAR